MYKIIIVSLVLWLCTSCTILGYQIPGTQKPETPPVVTPVTETPIVSTGTELPDTQLPLTETLSGDYAEYYALFNGTGTKVINATYKSGRQTKVSFINSTAKSAEISITFPNASGANLRFSQIVMPDGSMDGPFGIKTGYNLNQQGWYTLIFSENQMAGERWSGEAVISITLRDEAYDVDALQL